MNQKNFDFLSDQVKYTGFGDALQSELKEKMQKEAAEFQLIHKPKFGNDTVIAALHFKKSEQSDMYFFNKYDLALKGEHSSDMIEQTFYINKGNTITLKEAYNLMSGRAVNKDLTNKEGQVYNAWVQMDFKDTDSNGNFKLKHYHQNYGFNLGKELTKHPIKELSNEQDKAKLMESLQKGNRQSVTFVSEGSEQKMFIEANPQFKSVNVYDSSLQRLSSKHSKGETQAFAESSSVKQETKTRGQKQGSDEGDPEVPKTSKKRATKKRQSLS